MSVWSKIRGTIETIFQIGLGGPNLKNNGGALDVRNAGDSAYAVVRGDTPVTANDLTTKAYVDAAIVSGAIQEIRFPIGLVTTTSATSIPANAVICEAAVKIVTSYDVGTIAIGRTGSISLLMGTTDNLVTQVGQYEIPQDTAWGAGSLPIIATITGAPTVGSGFIIVKYSLPNN